jgi:hypothetical protein
MCGDAAAESDSSGSDATNADSGESVRDASGFVDSDSPGVVGVDAEAGAPTADGASCAATVPPMPNAMYLSNPAPTLMSTSNGFVLHKELNAFPNYGSKDNAADVLYDGQVGAWTFPIPSMNIRSATVVASMIADDHAPTPIGDASAAPAVGYSFLVWSAPCVYDGVQLPHGSPAAATFINWVQVSEPANLASGSTYTLTISNTSMTANSGDWIAIDWIELHVVTQ